MPTIIVDLSSSDYGKLGTEAAARHLTRETHAANMIRIALMAAAPAPSPPTTAQPPAPRYAYRITQDDTSAQMATMGAQGWQLVTTYLFRTNVVREWMSVL